jgi:hypothetical protein
VIVLSIHIGVVIVLLVALAMLRRRGQQQHLPLTDERLSMMIEAQRHTHD